MKRTRVVGLCVVAACAFGGIVLVSSASAAEIGECAAFTKGNYTESNCATVSESKGEPNHKGDFEFEPADSCYELAKHGSFTESACETVAEKRGQPDHKGDYESTASPTFTISAGPSELVTPGFGAFKCSALHGTGAVLGGTSTTEQYSYTGCETDSEKCGNTANEGEIETFPLVGSLEEPSKGLAATVLTGEASHGGYVAQFTCFYSQERLSGSVGGHDTSVNTMSSSSTFTFEKGFEQNLEAEFATSNEFNPDETEGPFAFEAHGVWTLRTSVPQEFHVN
jgi:hypothetical protein